MPRPFNHPKPIMSLPMSSRISVFKIIFSLSLILLGCLEMQSRNVTGQIIKLTVKLTDLPDTIDVTFIVPSIPQKSGIDFNKIKQSIRYIDSDGFKHLLFPADTVKIWFNYKKEKIRMLSRKTKTGEIIFMKLELEGKLKLLSNVYNNGEKYFIFERNKQIVRSLRTTQYIESLTSFFRSCPLLLAEIQKMENKDFTFATDREILIKKIVLFYNEQCIE